MLHVTDSAEEHHRHADYHPRVEPANWKDEQAIRPAVVSRKVWGGHGTDTGARAQGVPMSVFATYRRRPLAVGLRPEETPPAAGGR